MIIRAIQTTTSQGHYRYGWRSKTLGQFYRKSIRKLYRRLRKNETATEARYLLIDILNAGHRCDTLNWVAPKDQS